MFRTLRLLALAVLACLGASCASPPPSPALVEPKTVPESRDGHPFVTAERIRIDAPRDSVWSMLSASRLARQWSVIVHHIDVVSGRDGAVGTLRRCYLCPSGTFDERVVALEPPSYRKLMTVATSGLSGVKRDIAGNCAYQHLDSLDARTTELQLTVTYRLSYGPLSSLVNACYVRPRLRLILGRNLANMKALVETGERYRRVHEFEGDEARCP
jgi:polyketide cyclase/dehydrase/lipid transport protein